MAKKNGLGRATEALLAMLHDAVATDLLKRIQSGEATAQEIGAAIKFLKDNGIEAVLDSGNSKVEQIAEALPQFEDGEQPDLSAFDGLDGSIN